jgi:hypothetical protein
VNDGVISSSSKVVQNNFHWTSGGLTEIRISDYDDICFLCGMSLFDFLLFEAASDIPFISMDLFEEIVTSLQNEWPMKLAKDTARENESVKVTYIGEPFTSAGLPRLKPLLTKLHDGQSSASSRMEKIRALIDKTAAEISVGNFRLMRPPSAALDESGLVTQHTFCQGSVRLSPDMEDAHLPNDYYHMNAAYGRLLLEQLLA